MIRIWLWPSRTIMTPRISELTPTQFLDRYNVDLAVKAGYDPRNIGSDACGVSLAIIDRQDFAEVSAPPVRDHRPTGRRIPGP